jgi:hypothetical protein
VTGAGSFLGDEVAEFSVGLVLGAYDKEVCFIPSK